ncbi:MAG: hypothetical protein ACLS3C_17095 [Oscillospiraceae bacterium]
MSDLSAVVFVPDDTAKTGFSRPMMLQAIMGTPLLSWLTRSLAAGGVGRFFLVCHERFLSEAKHCFPDGCELSCAKLEETADQLHVFLSTADEQEEDVIVVTGPAVIDPFAVDEEAFSGAPVESGVSSVSRQALMDALDDTFIFTDFMKEHGIPYTDRDGVYAVSSMQQLAEWKPVLSRGRSVRSGPPQACRSGTMTTPMSSRPSSSGPGQSCCPGPCCAVRRPSPTAAPSARTAIWKT